MIFLIHSRSGEYINRLPNECYCKKFGDKFREVSELLPCSLDQAIKEDALIHCQAHRPLVRCSQ